GTTNFLYGFPAYAVSIAIEFEGDTVVGVVHDVSRGETFAAAKGRGATLDGRSIRTSDKDDLATALIGTGFGYSTERRRNQAALVASVLPQIRDIRRAGSAALDLCFVACGRLDGYFEQGIQHWDHAAGALIVREAGGVTGWVVGESPLLEPPVLLAAGPALFAPLAELLRAGE
ncbi:MAG TPA: inositol monophosphatase family protein, partial [Fimbriimonas sp.]